MSILERFHPATQAWFSDAFAAPTAVQEQGWGPIAAGENALLLAPTGSGKTLAAFLACIDRLVREPASRPGVRVLYISPLKALVYDIERNLRAPLVGIGNAAARQGASLRPIRVDVRTGDTSARDRRAQLKEPGEILVTTPESLYLLLGSRARETLRTVETVIVDEIHAVAHSKRGSHLALSLERLSAVADADPQRIGLSATQRPLEVIARFLGGDRPVQVVDTSEAPRLDLRVVVPVADMENPTHLAPGPAGDGQRQLTGGGRSDTPQRPRSGPVLGGAPPAHEKKAHGIWPAVHPELLALIRAHRSTIVFTNSRLLCERLAQRLNELAGEELVRAHHGSISQHQRREIEEALKAGQLPAIVATSSLELGIDMGAVDLVVLVESPGSVSRGLQRIGRAGHQVGARSEGRMFPKYRGDLLEAAVVARRMEQGLVEETRVPRNCLDVLSQQIVAMVSMEDRSPDELLAVVRRADPYRSLGEASFHAVLDMLSGRYPSDAFSDLRPRITWDRTQDRLSARPGAKKLAILNGGTIPDRGLYGVFLAGDGPRIGELDEEMVYESRAGDHIVLGATTWRVEEITRDRVVVSPAPGQPGRLPFWHGERPGRPLELGRAVGAFLRELVARPTPQRASWLAENTALDDFARRNLSAYVEEQQEATERVPTDRQIVVEAFRDELGDWRICLLTPFGARVHAPWAMAVEALLSARAGYAVQTLWADDGVVFRLADVDELPPLDLLIPDPEELEELVVEQVGRSALFASRFRENAGRAMLIPRREPGRRTPLWAQRLRSQELLAVAQRFPSFPIVLETYRECLQEVFDLPALTEVLSDIRARRVRVHQVETSRPSPFARSLVFAWVAAFMYDADAPLAERRAQALTLDRALLRELLGQAELRELLDADAVADVEAELQRLAPDRRARHPDALHDILRRLGDLSEAEVAARCDGDPREWLRSLETQARALAVRIGGELRFIAGEDAGRYRDALGVAVPPGVPRAYLEAVDRPLESLVLRYAATHGPFVASALVERWGLPAGAVDAVLRSLEASDELVLGDIRPGGRTPEWCHPDVLRRLKRRSLARLRKEVEPVDAAVLGRFLPAWHGVGAARGGPGRLQEVVEQLEGLPLPVSVLESEILPARIRGFESRMLDELGAMGQLVWVGRGSLGARDGRIALYRRDRVPLLVDPPEPSDELLDGEESALRRTIWEYLGQRGACFLVELQQAAGNPPGSELQDALWDLVWAGLITNDTFAPLRSLGASKARRSRSSWSAGGRWSRVATLIGPVPEPTARAHARAAALLERYGVASREAAKSEGLVGGFSGIYDVYRAMEEGGRVRRGWFVAGLGGAQFALPGAVDRLRAHRDDEGVAVSLSAVDPANPWGALLGWPETADGLQPRRVAGARVVLVGGEPVLYADKGLRTWITFPAAADPERLRRAVADVAAWRVPRGLRIERIDGGPAGSHAIGAAFLEQGFADGYQGLERGSSR